METPRHLDLQAVEAAEFARINDKLMVASEFAAIGMGLVRPFTQEELAVIAQNKEQRVVLACLARIHVDSLKTTANKSLAAWRITDVLHKATETIRIVHGNWDFTSLLEGVRVDHRGREHDFLAEMPRDVAKVTVAASVLYPAQTANQLIKKGEEILEDLHLRLFDDNKTKPLVMVEIQLSKLARGAREYDQDVLIRAFNELTIQASEKPHRVATVASWLRAWGEKIDSKEMIVLGTYHFNNIITKHPEWGFMAVNERKKLKLSAIRSQVISLTAPFLSSTNKRQEIYQRLSK